VYVNNEMQLMICTLFVVAEEGSVETWAWSSNSHKF